MANRIKVKDTNELHQLILSNYGTLKYFAEETGLSESTVHRIIKTGKVSPHAANTIMRADLGVREFSTLFEITED